MEGADALKKLARSLIDSYRNVISAGMELRTKAAPMEKGNSPILRKLIKRSGRLIPVSEPVWKISCCWLIICINWLTG